MYIYPGKNITEIYLEIETLITLRRSFDFSIYLYLENSLLKS